MTGFGRSEGSEAGLAWLGDFNALVHPHKRAAGSFPAADEWRGALERIRAFTPWQAAEFTQVHRIGVEDFVALVGSWSWIANLPDGQRAELLDQVRALARSEDAVLSLPYATEVYWTRLEV